MNIFKLNKQETVDVLGEGFEKVNYFDKITALIPICNDISMISQTTRILFEPSIPLSQLSWTPYFTPASSNFNIILLISSTFFPLTLFDIY